MERMVTVSSEGVAALPRPRATGPPRLRHGRTWMLAPGDLVALTSRTRLVLVSDQIAPLPPVSGSAWFLRSSA